MLDGLLGRSNFKTKCKSAITRTKTRLEIIKRKRNAMEKFLKKDIAEHLKSNLDRNAYGRAEGLYMELNLSSCYDYIGKCCTCISQHLKEMHNQSECVEESKVAVASLIYSAARFFDLPELCDLKIQFYDKYGKALEPFVDKEFSEKLKSKPPTVEMKLKLMQHIAREFSVSWDPEPLQQQLQSHYMTKHGHSGAGDDYKINRTISEVFQVGEKRIDGDKEMDGEQTVMTRSKMLHSQSCSAISDELQEQQKNKVEHGISVSSSRNDNSEDDANVKPFTKEIVPAPYEVNKKADKDGNFTEDEDFVYTCKEKQSQNLEMGNNGNEDLVGRARPRPRSVRTKFLKQSHTTVNNFDHEITDVKETLSARAPREARYGLPKAMEDENKSFRTLSDTRSCNSTEQTMSELPLPPGRRRYFFPESQPASLHKQAEGNIKSELPNSLQSM